MKCGWCEIRALTLGQPESEAEPKAARGYYTDGSATPLACMPCSLGFRLTEYQAWERKIALPFEKAVRALFSLRHCNQISQNRNQTDCQLGAVQAAATVRTKTSSEMTKPQGRKWGRQPLGLIVAFLGDLSLKTLLQVRVLQSIRRGFFLELSVFG